MPEFSRALEHLLIPGRVIRDPVFEVRISFRGKDFYYGILDASEEEIQEGILFRSTLVAGCSMAGEVLEEVTAILVALDGECEYSYNVEEMEFKPKG